MRKRNHYLSCCVSDWRCRFTHHMDHCLAFVLFAYQLGRWVLFGIVFSMACDNQDFFSALEFAVSAISTGRRYECTLCFKRVLHISLSTRRWITSTSKYKKQPSVDDCCRHLCFARRSGLCPCAGENCRYVRWVIFWRL